MNIDPQGSWCDLGGTSGRSSSRSRREEPEDAAEPTQLYSDEGMEELEKRCNAIRAPSGGADTRAMRRDRKPSRSSSPLIKNVAGGFCIPAFLAAAIVAAAAAVTASPSTASRAGAQMIATTLESAGKLTPKIAALSRFMKARSPSTPESEELSAIVQAPDDAEVIAITALQSAMRTLLSKGYKQQDLINEIAGNEQQDDELMKFHFQLLRNLFWIRSLNIAHISIKTLLLKLISLLDLVISVML